MKPTQLTARQGKTLRYLVTRGAPVQPSQIHNKMWWSDLPKNVWEAKIVLEQLKAFGLAKLEREGYTYTQAGIKVLVAANSKDLWSRRGMPPV